MPQKLFVNKFELIEDTSQFNENFIKNYNEETNAEHIMENCMNFIMIYHFYQKE